MYVTNGPVCYEMIYENYSFNFMNEKAITIILYYNNYCEGGYDVCYLALSVRLASMAFWRSPSSSILLSESVSRLIYVLHIRNELSSNYIITFHHNKINKNTLTRMWMMTLMVDSRASKPNFSRMVSSLLAALI